MDGCPQVTGNLRSSCGAHDRMDWHLGPRQRSESMAEFPLPVARSAGECGPPQRDAVAAIPSASRASNRLLRVSCDPSARAVCTSRAATSSGSFCFQSRCDKSSSMPPPAATAKRWETRGNAFGVNVHSHRTACPSESGFKRLLRFSSTRKHSVARVRSDGVFFMSRHEMRRSFATVLLVAVALHQEALHCAVHSGTQPGNRLSLHESYPLSKSCQATSAVAEIVECPLKGKVQGCEDAAHPVRKRSSQSSENEVDTKGGSTGEEGKSPEVSGDLGVLERTSEKQNGVVAGDGPVGERVAGGEGEGTEKKDVPKYTAITTFCWGLLNRMSLGAFPVLQTARPITASSNEESDGQSNNSVEAPQRQLAVAAGAPHYYLTGNGKVEIRIPPPPGSRQSLGPKVILEPVTKANFQQVVALIGDPNDPSAKSDASTAGAKLPRFNRHVERPGFKEFSYLAYVDNQLVGAIGCAEKPSLPQKLHILFFRVLSTHQNLGIGALIINFVLRKASIPPYAARYTATVLHVWVRNIRELNFFTQLGYKAFKFIPGHYKKLHPSAAYRLQLELPWSRAVEEMRKVENLDPNSTLPKRSPTTIPRTWLETHNNLTAFEVIGEDGADAERSAAELVMLDDRREEAALLQSDAVRPALFEELKALARKAGRSAFEYDASNPGFGSSSLSVSEGERGVRDDDNHFIKYFDQYLGWNDFEKYSRVAMVRGRLAGVITCAAVPGKPNRLHIIFFAVNPLYKKLGVAAFLMDNLLTVASMTDGSTPNKHLTLHVWEEDSDMYNFAFEKGFTIVRYNASHFAQRASPGAFLFRMELPRRVRSKMESSPQLTGFMDPQGYQKLVQATYEAAIYSKSLGGAKELSSLAGTPEFIQLGSSFDNPSLPPIPEPQNLINDIEGDPKFRDTFMGFALPRCDMETKARGDVKGRGAFGVVYTLNSLSNCKANVGELTDRRFALKLFRLKASSMDLLERLAQLKLAGKVIERNAVNNAELTDVYRQLKKAIRHQETRPLIEAAMAELGVKPDWALLEKIYHTSSFQLLVENVVTVIQTINTKQYITELREVGMILRKLDDSDIVVNGQTLSAIKMRPLPQRVAKLSEICIVRFRWCMPLTRVRFHEYNAYHWGFLMELFDSDLQPSSSPTSLTGFKADSQKNKNLLTISRNIRHIFIIVQRILRAVATLHVGFGVGHFDIKPLNILLSRLENGDLSVSLADFGMASSLQSSVTSIRGTTAFMAPELERSSTSVSGKRWEALLDAYALGTTFAELLMWGNYYASTPWVKRCIQPALEPSIRFDFKSLCSAEKTVYTERVKRALEDCFETGGKLEKNYILEAPQLLRLKVAQLASPWTPTRVSAINAFESITLYQKLDHLKTSIFPEAVRKQVVKDMNAQEFLQHVLFVAKVPILQGTNESEMYMLQNTLLKMARFDPIAEIFVAESRFPMAEIQQSLLKSPSFLALPKSVEALKEKAREHLGLKEAIKVWGSVKVSQIDLYYGITGQAGWTKVFEHLWEKRKLWHLHHSVARSVRAAFDDIPKDAKRQLILEDPEPSLAGRIVSELNFEQSESQQSIQAERLRRWVVDCWRRWALVDRILREALVDRRAISEVQKVHDKLLAAGDEETSAVVSVTEIADFRQSVMSRALSISRNRYNEVVWEYETETRLGLATSSIQSKLHNRLELIARTLQPPQKNREALKESIYRFLDQQGEAHTLLKEPANLVKEVMKFVRKDNPSILPVDEEGERTEYYKVLFDWKTYQFREHVLAVTTAKIVSKLAVDNLTKRAEITSASPNSDTVKVSPDEVVSEVIGRLPKEVTDDPDVSNSLFGQKDRIASTVKEMIMRGAADNMKLNGWEWLAAPPAMAPAAVPPAMAPAAA